MEPVNPAPPARITPLTASELTSIALEMQALVGAQLQDCLQTSSEFGLAFYHQGDTVWLWFDLQPLRPLVVRLYGKAPARKKIPRPLTLFLRSRFFGRRLASVEAVSEQGRVLRMAFHRARDEDDPAAACEIEVRLIPHAQNIIARDGEKSIAENKPKDLPPSQAGHAPREADRSWEAIEGAWRALQNQKPVGVARSRDDAASVEKDWQRTIEKKELALTRMRDDLHGKISDLPAQAGEWLKAHPNADLRADVPEEWREQIDPAQSMSWNIEHCFRRAKDGARKADGTRARLRTVEAELAELRARGPGSFARARDKSEKNEGQSLLSRAQARGRRHKLADDLEVYIGKSAADNLALLRRAQPFDYWLHLREQPGSHAIMRRVRTRVVSDAEFLQAGAWVVEQSLGKRVSELKGDRFDLLIVECRYVRPIKGDKIGRVNYTHDRVLTLRF